MNFAALGPPIPPVARDTVPFTIDTRAIITDLNHAGEAVVKVTGRCYQCQSTHTVLMFVNPHTLQVTRATLTSAGRPAEVVEPTHLPGMLTDIASTMTAELFPVARAA